MDLLGMETSLQWHVPSALFLYVRYLSSRLKRISESFQEGTKHYANSNQPSKRDLCLTKCVLVFRTANYFFRCKPHRINPRNREGQIRCTSIYGYHLPISGSRLDLFKPRFKWNCRVCDKREI